MTAPRPPLLERAGLSFFERRSARLPGPEAKDGVHVLDASERAALMRVERGAILRAALAGALSATASAVAELLADAWIPGDFPLFSAESGRYWLLVGGATLVASVIEIGFLTWDTLRSVHELARVSGVQLFEGQVAQALARAALELPNPVEGPHGIDPHREVPKAQLALAAAAYKAKVGVTNFVFKLLVRRALGRSALRSVANAVVPFVAVPVTAAWNALVAFRVLREARVRAMGPSAAQELVGAILGEGPAPSPRGRMAMLRAVAAAIVRTRDLHPNLLAVLDAVGARAGAVAEGAVLDDVGLFLAELRSLSAPEQADALAVLALACIADGRLTRRERQLYEEACRVVGREAHLERLERLRRELVRGAGFEGEALRSL